MFANLLPWLLSHALRKLPTQLENAVEDIVKVGIFSTQALHAEVGDAVTSQPIHIDELGKEFDVQVIIKRTK